MTTEIERRFLVVHLPPGVEAASGTRLLQGYLALDGGVTVRVRAETSSHVLTVKGGGGLVRTEVECVLDAAQFAALWPLTEGRRIDKIRCREPVGGHIAEIDIFGGDLEGLVIAEVEFGSVDEASAFQPPGWCAREVTGDPSWSNAALAVHGLPGHDDRASLASET